MLKESCEFAKGVGHCDLQRGGEPWEVKVCKDSGLTINQNKTVAGENYIVVNDKANTQVVRIWVLWQATDAFFSPKKANSNARALIMGAAAGSVQELYRTPISKTKTDTHQRDPTLPFGPKAQAG